MSTEADPIVGNWYRHLDKGQAFQVVAVDDTVGLVEVQHFDGDLEEMELEAWYQLDLEPIEEPENWSGPLDVGETDDLTGTDVSDTSSEDWTEPLQEIALSEEPAPEDEAWGEGYPTEAFLEAEPGAEQAGEKSFEEEA